MTLSNVEMKLRDAGEERKGKVPVESALFAVHHLSACVPQVPFFLLHEFPCEPSIMFGVIVILLVLFISSCHPVRDGVGANSMTQALCSCHACT